MKIYIKHITLLLLVLIISMPISIASSLNLYVRGDDGIDNMIRGTDHPIVYANFDNSMLNEDVFYVSSIGQTTEFDSCEDNLCVYNIDKTDFKGIERVGVKYKTYSGLKDKSINVIVDSMGPKISDFYISDNIVSDSDDINMRFNVKDFSCNDVLCNNKCSGISKIIISEDSLDNVVYELDINSNKDECSKSINHVFKSSDLKLKEGQNTLLIQAIDNFGNAGNFYPISIVYDSTPPTLEDDSFYLSVNNNGISFYNYELNNVEVSFYLDDNNVSEVSVDFSELNPALSKEILNCDNLRCSRIINLKPTISSNTGSVELNLPVEIVDKVGNSKTYILKNKLNIDREAPKIRKVSSSIGDYNSIIALSSNSNLIVDLDDVSGLSKANVFVDYSQVSSKGNIKALNCSEEGICVFPKVKLTKDGKFNLKVSGITQDNLGNKLGNDYPFEIVCDDTKPFVKDVHLYFETDREKNVEEFPTKGDSLHVIAIVKDMSDVIAEGNFSEINDQSGSFSVTCTHNPSLSKSNLKSSRSHKSNGNSRKYVKTNSDTGVPFRMSPKMNISSIIDLNSSKNNLSDDSIKIEDISKFNISNINLKEYAVCDWRVPITNSGTIIGKQAELTFRDSFNNSLSQSIDLPLIYGLFNDTNPNYWGHITPVCSPSVLDRQVGSLMKQKVYCKLKLTPLTNNNQKILSLKLKDCSSKYLDDSKLNGNGKESYLTLLLKKDDYEINNLNVVCKVGITSQVGTNYVLNEEVENVTIPISFFNNPFGMPDNNLIDKIEDVRKTWAEGFGKVIFWLSLLEKVSTEICHTMNTVVSVANIFTGTASGVPDWNGGCGVRTSSEAVDQTADGLYGTLLYFCKFVNCNYASSDEGYLTYGGGTAFSETLNDVQYYSGGQLVDSLGGDYKQYMDVKNNIYLSAVTLCVPGIIRGLSKYRQIQCFYGYCLQDLSVMGVPYETCEEQKAYQECKYFVTPIFTFFPIVNLFDQVTSSIKNALSDPFVALGTVMHWYCWDCSQVGWGVCRISRMIDVATDVYKNYISIKDLVTDWDNDYCEDLTDSPRSLSHSSSGGRGVIG